MEQKEQAWVDQPMVVRVHLLQEWEWSSGMSRFDVFQAWVKSERHWENGECIACIVQHTFTHGLKGHGACP